MPLPMPGAMQAGIQDWLSAEIASSFAAAFEGTMGEACAVERAAPRVPPESALFWRQKFSNVRGALWIAAVEPDWTAAGECVARAAGLAESDAAALKSEYLEIVAQACSALARAISGRLNREAGCEHGGESAPPAGGPALLGSVVWTPLQIRIGPAVVQILAGMETLLLEEFSEDPAPAKPAFDLLLDIELPVSISFGRAQIPLKDLLKLTTGSIVELNRSIGDPVEVIVNNCVIARGEVVVVDGNFGVRIHQVISRQERLRTLD